MDSRGIEPRTTPMLREYYTTKPQAQLIEDRGASIGSRRHRVEWQCVLSVGHYRDTAADTKSIKEGWLGEPAIGDGFQICGIEWEEGFSQFPRPVPSIQRTE